MKRISKSMKEQEDAHNGFGITTLPSARISVKRGQSVFIISDPHFCHKNIIRYCQRPFLNVNDMNQTIINNWNAIIEPEDLVIILGDVAPYCRPETISFWLSRLNGKKILINGNHDHGFIQGCEAVIKWGAVLDYAGESFVLTHDPIALSKEVVGGCWLIHGHVHNNNTRTYPLISHKNKTMNVCVEMLDYKPIEMKQLLGLRADAKVK